MATLALPHANRRARALAFDYSTARYMDDDGRLHVKDCPITKACVNMYYGWEIPGHEELGLDPKKEYHLLRDPAELEKALPRFGGVPLLDEHTDHDADNPKKDNVAGAIGTGCYMDGDYVRTPLLSVWNTEDINGIQNEEKRELSSSYAYDPVMKPGNFKGLHYDGRMVNIRPNHVALVRRGRAGRDVLVMDALPEGLKMKRIAFDRFTRKAKALFANDADIAASELLELLAAGAKSDGEGEGEGNAEDDDPDGDNEGEGADDEGGEKDDDEEGDGEEGKGKKDGEGKGEDKARDQAPRRRANDAEAIRRQVVRDLSEYQTACDKVFPHIGRVKLAMDAVDGGAATLYKRALDAHNVNHKGVKDVVSLERMVDMLPSGVRPAMAHDSEPNEASPLDTALKGAVHISRS